MFDLVLNTPLKDAKMPQVIKEKTGPRIIIALTNKIINYGILVFSLCFDR